MKRFLPFHIIGLLFFFHSNLVSQAKQIINSLIKSEGKIIVREGAEGVGALSHVIDESVPAFRNLSKSRKLSEGLKSNMKIFFNEVYLETKEISGDFVQRLAEQELENYNANNSKLNDIKSNVLFPKLYAAICTKLSIDTIDENCIDKLLLGKMCFDYRIDSVKLYWIYFNLSDNFAKDELTRMLNFYQCESGAIEEIKSIAMQRKVELDYSTCASNETDSSDAFIGLFIIGLIIYLLYRVVKFFRRFLSSKKAN